jgi:hypothetical protein
LNEGRRKLSLLSIIGYFLFVAVVVLEVGNSFLGSSSFCADLLPEILT